MTTRNGGPRAANGRIQNDGGSRSEMNSPSAPAQCPSIASTGHPLSQTLFSLSPEELAKLVATKSIADLEALGGLDGLVRGLNTSLSAGLNLETHQPTTDDIPSQDYENDLQRLRAEVYGVNRIPPKPTKGIFELMLIALGDRVLILLCIAAVLSLLLGLYQTFVQPHIPGQPRIEWVDSLTIMAAVLIVVMTGAVNDYQKEKHFARLVKKTEDRTVKAIRCGRLTELSMFDVLVGDILDIAAGSLVPADGVLVTGYSIRCDESSITGESKHIKKVGLKSMTAETSVISVTRDIDPFIVSGSRILGGAGTYLVTGVGVNSMYGRLKMGVTERTEPTPLQKKLSGIADKIAIAGVSVAVLLFGVLAIKLLVQSQGSTRPLVELVQSLLRVLMISISVFVVAVPEGLPLAVTLALAIGVTRMLRDNNLVRVLAACETMGNTTVVCCDKTGTLTVNRMTVVSGRLGVNGAFQDLEQDDEIHDEQCRGNVSANILCSSMHPEVRNLMVRSIAINSTAMEGVVDEVSTFVGSSTESALLHFATTWMGMRPVHEERANVPVIYLYPFDSARKYMATVTQMDSQTYRIYVKGAPEVILQKCARVLKSEAFPLPNDADLTREYRNKLMQATENYGKQALRTIGFAYKDVVIWPPSGNSSSDEALECAFENLTFISLMAIHDPPRPEVRSAISKCIQAGVSVKMVTGDNIQTARATAVECGILTDSGAAIEGPQFRALSETEMYAIIPRLQVLARSSPEDKKILVERLKELGETVAVTGDGTNDGPALRTADVGFSMGISGTDVAKEASSIVLIDDNFSSIVKAIEWGRSICDVIKKFIHFQLTVNITAVTLTFVSAVSSDTGKSVLSPAQLLWVNLIMDTFAALALATDSPNPAVLQRAPDTKAMPLISTTGWKMIIGQAIYQLVVILVLSFKGAQILHLQPEQRASLETFIFNTFVWMQLFNLYNNRRIDNNFNVFEGIYKNYFFIAVNIVIITGQVLIVSIGGSALSTTPLSAKEWIVSVILGVMCMPIAVLLRLIPDEAVTGIFGARTAQNNQRVFRGRTTCGDSVWFSTIYHIRCELSAKSKSHTSKFHDMLHELCKLVQRTEDTLIDERTPLLPIHETNMAFSRTDSVCAPSVVMVGMIAGGVGGWPRVAVDH